MDRFLEDGKTLKEAIDQMMKKSHLDEKFLDMELQSRWEDLAGSLIARHTIDLSTRNRTLYLKLNSAPLKQEVNFRKQLLINKINTKMGKTVISEIVIS